MQVGNSLILWTINTTNPLMVLVVKNVAKVRAKFTSRKNLRTLIFTAKFGKIIMHILGFRLGKKKFILLEYIRLGHEYCVLLYLFVCICSF